MLSLLSLAAPIAPATSPALYGLALVANAPSKVALTSLELARDEASRQSRYLATYIRPTLAEDSEYPKRGMFALLAGLILLMSWSILVLIYYSVRDRR